MGFFDSPQVKQGIEEAEFLKKRLVEQSELVMQNNMEDEEIAIEYLHTLYALVEKEHGLYTRYRLSGDVEALIAASELDGAKIAAMETDYPNGDAYYRALKRDIKTALKKVTDEDPDEPYEPI
jgi:hypothetical protein